MVLGQLLGEKRLRIGVVIGVKSKKFLMIFPRGSKSRLQVKEKGLDIRLMRKKLAPFVSPAPQPHSLTPTHRRPAASQAPFQQSQGPPTHPACFHHPGPPRPPKSIQEAPKVPKSKKPKLKKINLIREMTGQSFP